MLGAHDIAYKPIKMDFLYKILEFGDFLSYFYALRDTSMPSIPKFPFAGLDANKIVRKKDAKIKWRISKSLFIRL